MARDRSHNRDHLEIEVILDQEREDRLRPRLKDRRLADWFFIAQQPLHRDDIDVIAYYLGFAIYGATFVYLGKYFRWVWEEFKSAKQRDDAALLRLHHLRAQESAKTIQGLDQKRAYSTWRGHNIPHSLARTQGPGRFVLRMLRL
jgi:hypothetical protein